LNNGLVIPLAESTYQRYSYAHVEAE